MDDQHLSECPSVRYPVSLFICPDLVSLLEKNNLLSDVVDTRSGILHDHPFLVDLLRIEEAQHQLTAHPSAVPKSISKPIVNPNLKLLHVNWRLLPELLADTGVVPVSGDDYVLVYKKPGRSVVTVKKASPQNLLALKILTEEIDPRQVAAEGKVSLGAVDGLIAKARRDGLIIGAPTGIKRPVGFPIGENIGPEFFSSPTFTLQWHITQACDLDCRHCYDRSDREPMPLGRAIGVLDDLYDFCHSRHAFCQISFSGGNPLLYPHFDALYAQAADRGFMTAILGNPAPKARMEKIMAVQTPEFYQISLEGLASHNDYMRGAGHYERAVDFLQLLGDLGIYRMVMLTLTADNVDEVIQLADRLRGLTELFTFNRLAAVGRGAGISPVAAGRFHRFLQQYMDAARTNPVMGFKDNLFNLLRREKEMPLFGGCAGYGCGAAFNFVCLLPDGEVHACRKFPSPIGNIYNEALDDIYTSQAARRYRSGAAACRDCPIRPVCGGCLAVSYAAGRNIFEDADPYCFQN